MAEDEGLKVDHAGFEKEMDAQRERARSARSTEKSMGVQSALLTDIKVESKFIDTQNKNQIVNYWSSLKVSLF